MLAYPSREEWKCFSLKGVSSVFVYIGWFLTSSWTTYIRNANISETCSVEKICMFCGENSHLYFTFRKEFTHVHIGRGSGLMLLIFCFHFLYKMLQELLFSCSLTGVPLPVSSVFFLSLSTLLGTKTHSTSRSHCIWATPEASFCAQYFLWTRPNQTYRATKNWCWTIWTKRYAEQ